MDDTSEYGEEPPNLRFLRVLVTVLTATMIAGVVIIIALIVIRYGGKDEFTLPDGIALPEGAEVSAFTKGRGWWAVVTEDQQILIYDAGTGELRQSVQVTAD
ncbi:DUF6476 family protein [Actibacterium sp. XHP0104]|nr:DUF6476 family protein [Actibacterium sp. XHP0104]